MGPTGGCDAACGPGRSRRFRGHGHPQVGEQILQKATKSYAKRRRSSETISGFLQWYLRDMVTAYATGKWRPIGRLSGGGTSAAGTCEVRPL